MQQIVDLPLVRLVLHRLDGEVEARPDGVELQRIELLFLDQHLLADADFAEVVQQRGVANLLDLVGSEADIAILPVVDAVDHFGQLDGEVRHAERVAGGGRIALLDRRDRRGDEALEQPLDRFVEQVVLDRHRGLPGQGAHQLDDFRNRGISIRKKFLQPRQHFRRGRQMLQFPDDLFGRNSGSFGRDADKSHGLLG